MFRVEFFVDDKYLAVVMHSIAGRTRNLSVLPVSNAQEGPNGQLQQKAGSTAELIMKEIRKRKLKQVTSVQMREIVQANGMSPSSWNHFSQQLTGSGLLKKTKVKGVYDVVVKA